MRPTGSFRLRLEWPLLIVGILGALSLISKVPGLESQLVLQSTRREEQAIYPTRVTPLLKNSTGIHIARSPNNYSSHETTEKAFPTDNEWPKKAPVWPGQISSHLVDAKDRIVVLIATCPYLDFLDNAIHSIMNVGVTNFVVVPMDQSTYKVATEMYPGHVVQVPYHFPGAGLALSKAVEVNSEEFKQLSSSRALILLAFLKLNYTVFYCDIDVYWRHNPLDFFEESAWNTTEIDTSSSDKTKTSPFDLVAMVDSKPIQDGRICSGYLYLKPTPNSLYLLEKWNQEMQTGQHKNDQYAIYWAYNKTFDRVRVKLYPAKNGYFPSGKGYVLMPQAKKDNVLLVHNNWIMGHSRKLARFQKWNLWHPSGKLDQVEYKCTS
jgi:hypothetical protein